MPAHTTTLLDARALERTVKRMADEIVELNAGVEELILVGIQRRGVQLAQRVAQAIRDAEGAEVPRGALDITLYRDDLQTVGPRPVVGPTSLPANIDGKRVVIVDDVLYTGRTVRPVYSTSSTMTTRLPSMFAGRLVGPTTGRGPTVCRSSR